jgi:hypothetical protein
VTGIGEAFNPADAGKWMDSQIFCGVMAKQKAPDARLAKAEE